jgi:hypothetical protein
MAFKKILKSLVIAGVLFSPLCAGELKVKNETTTTVKVTVKAKENQSSKTFNFSTNVKPAGEITITIDEKEYKGATFVVHATTVIDPSDPSITATDPSIPPLTSEDCILAGHAGRVVVALTPDHSKLFCAVTLPN